MACMFELFWPRPKAKVFYIEGNVGVGKTETMLELAELLREHGVAVACLDQKVDDWSDQGFMLDMATERGLQFFAAYAMLQDYADRAHFVATQATAFDVILIERHPTTTLDVFEDSLDVHKLYTSVDTISGFLQTPENTIYLKNAPAVCYARTMRRARKEEKVLDEESFQHCDHKHEEMLTKRKALGGNVFVSDALGGDSHHHLIASIAASIGYNTKRPPPM
jgi:thymidylate kinase